MRPVRIRLEGFLSHRDTEVDLQDVRAAVVVGDNGAGKTGLLDGITWALFGKRPRPGHPVNDRSTECRVTLWFEAGAFLWRVIRERSITSGGKTSLAFAVQIGDFWEPAGGTNIAEIQRAIEDTVGLGYDTFLGSSFIGQGLADEFTRRRPAERKELLYQLLDLGRYERWCQDARDLERQLAGQAVQVQRQSEDIEDSLAEEEKAREHLTRAKYEEQKAASGLSDAEEQLKGAGAELQQARERVAAVGSTRQELDHLRRERIGRRDRLRGDVERIRREAKSLEGQQDEASTELRQLDQLSRGATTLEAETTAKKLAADSLEQEAVVLRDKAEVIRTVAGVAEREATLASRLAAEAATRIDILSKGDATCFACGQLLSQEDRDRMIGELGEIQTSQRRRFTEQGAMAAAKGTEVGQLRQTADQKDHEADRIRQQISELKTKAERGRVAGERIPDVTRNLERIREKTAELEAELEKVHGELAGLDDPTEQERELEAELAGAKEASDRLDRVQVALVDAESKAGLARGRHTAAIAAVAKAEEVVRRHQESRDSLDGIMAEHRRLVSARFTAGILAELWGKNGIPATRIENAVPQIEVEANRELERFTDGRFVVRLETQRPTQKSGIRETLDVLVIADGAERPLEELSGGERQVVDLALRIGLARLLAHRAGRRIQTLVLDEAFTALDTGRRQRAVEVLRALMDEFDLVLAVTHDREFADTFPTRIEVDNAGEGSVVDVVRLEETVAA